MSSVTRSARLLELQALNALQKLELQKLNKAVARRNKRIRNLQSTVASYQRQEAKNLVEHTVEVTVEETRIRPAKAVHVLSI